jgi:hypothetical protein
VIFGIVFWIRNRSHGTEVRELKKEINSLDGEYKQLESDHTNLLMNIQQQQQQQQQQQLHEVEPRRIIDDVQEPDDVVEDVEGTDADTEDESDEEKNTEEANVSDASEDEIDIDISRILKNNIEIDED